MYVTYRYKDKTPEHKLGVSVFLHYMTTLQIEKYWDDMEYFRVDGIDMRTANQAKAVMGLFS